MHRVEGRIIRLDIGRDCVDDAIGSRQNRIDRGLVADIGLEEPDTL